MKRPLERVPPLGRLTKTLIKRALGDQRLGQIDHFRFPERGNAWGGPFNGQELRRQLFLALMHAAKPTSIVETGTYLGTTTEFFAATGLPVFTVEGQARNYGYAQARLRRLRNVHVIHCDSRSALRALLPPGGGLPESGVPFVYLDAHWNEDLPLAEELEVTFSLTPDALVMVDDFEVPGDPGYAFDDYGPGNALNAAYIQRAVRRHRLAVFYPRMPSRLETGARRGCVVLAKRDRLGRALSNEPLLQPQKRRLLAQRRRSS